jgi:hypothetical protein
MRVDKVRLIEMAVVDSPLPPYCFFTATIKPTTETAAPSNGAMTAFSAAVQLLRFVDASGSGSAIRAPNVTGCTVAGMSVRFFGGSFRDRHPLRHPQDTPSILVGQEMESWSVWAYPSLDRRPCRCGRSSKPFATGKRSETP